MVITKKHPTTLNKVFGLLTNILFPMECFHCGSLIPSEGKLPICNTCNSKLAVNQAPHCPRCGFQQIANTSCKQCQSLSFETAVDQVFFALRYEGLAKELVQKFKMNPSFHLIPLWKHWIREMFLGRQNALAEYQLIVPIPPHSDKPFSPWNPCIILAEIVSELIESPVKNLIRRKKRMLKQSKLPLAERRANVSDGYQLLKDISIIDQRILIVDDIITTGITAQACAELLKTNGAHRVGVLACARGIRNT